MKIKRQETNLYLGPMGDESDTEMQTTANVTSNKDENIDNFILAADWRSCSTTNVTIDSKSTAFLYSKRIYTKTLQFV